MRRLLLAGALVAAGLTVPTSAGADDVSDGAECRAGNADAFTLPHHEDRYHVCVRASDRTIFYLGGELQAEEEEQRGPFGACGALIVADMNLTGTEDWDNAGPDGEWGTEDDEHCD